MECNICLEINSNFPKDKLAVASCGHVFHNSCIKEKFADNWRISCPNCGKKIRQNKIRTLKGIEPKQNSKRIKISVIGGIGVGKSCLSRRFSNDLYEDGMKNTLGIDYWTKDIYINEEFVQLKIWDTSGQERFGCITSQLIRGSHGILIAYDTTHIDSLDLTKSWFAFANEHAPNAIKMLVGCKMDLKECNNYSHKDSICIGPTEQEKMKVANDLGLHVFETSAKSEENVEIVFRDLTVQILENLTTCVSDNTVVKVGHSNREKRNSERKWKC